MTSHKKEFDCVEMKREGAARVREAIKRLSPEQQVDFWKHQTAELRRQQAESRTRQTRKTA